MSVGLKKLFAKSAAVAAFVATAACTGGTVYHDYMHTQQAGWEKTDTLVFAVPPVGASGKYREVVCMRTTGDFPFKSVTLVVEQRILPRNITRTDILKCTLTDKNGNVEGNGVSMYQYEFELRDIQLDRGDSLDIRIRHDMKRETLSGISDVGVKIAR